VRPASSQSKIKPLRLARVYFGCLRQFAGGRRLLGMLGLVAACAVLEGVGLAMLVPLLGWISGEGGANGPRWWVESHWRPSLPGLLAMFVGLIALRALVIRLRDVELLRLRLGFVDHLREQLQAGLANASWRFLSRIQHADVLHVLVADLNRVSQGTFFLLQGITSLAMGVAGLCVALSISVPLTVIALAVASVLALAMRRQLGRALSLGVDLSQAQRNFFASATEFLSGLKLIKASGAEARHVARCRPRPRPHFRCRSFSGAGAARSRPGQPQNN